MNEVNVVGYRLKSKSLILTAMARSASVKALGGGDSNPMLGFVV